MPRDLFPSPHYETNAPSPPPPPPHSWLPPFLVKISHPPPPPTPHYSHFWKVLSPRFHEGEGGFRLLRPWIDVIHYLYHSNYYFIFTFLEICMWIAKRFNRIIVKIYAVNLFLCCNIYKIQLNFPRGKKWRWKLSGNLAVFCIYFCTSIL